MDTCYHLATTLREKGREPQIKESCEIKEYRGSFPYQSLWFSVRTHFESVGRGFESLRARHIFQIFAFHSLPLFLSELRPFGIDFDSGPVNLAQQPHSSSNIYYNRLMT